MFRNQLGPRTGTDVSLVLKTITCSIRYSMAEQTLSDKRGKCQLSKTQVLGKVLCCCCMRTASAVIISLLMPIIIVSIPVVVARTLPLTRSRTIDTMHVSGDVRKTPLTSDKTLVSKWLSHAVGQRRLPIFALTHFVLLPPTSRHDIACPGSVSRWRFYYNLLL